MTTPENDEGEQLRIADDPSAPEALRELVRARRSEALDPARAARIAAAVMARGGGNDGGGPSGQPAASGVRWAPVALSGAAAVLLGLVGVVAWPGQQDTTVAAEPAPAALARARQEPTPPPSVVEPAPSPAPPPIEAASTQAPPEDRPARRGRSVPPTDGPTELELVAEARETLGRSPAAALALLERHRQTYPRGALVEEREVLAVEALLRLGRRARAESRAQAFLERFPSSAYRRRLGELIGTSAPP